MFNFIWDIFSPILNIVLSETTSINMPWCQGWWIFISSPALFFIFSVSEWEDFHSKPLNTDHLSSLGGTSCLWFPFVSLTVHTHILMTKNSVYFYEITWKTLATFIWQLKYKKEIIFGVKMSVIVVITKQNNIVSRTKKNFKLQILCLNAISTTFNPKKTYFC